jgi:hypothetical protein
MSQSFSYSVTRVSSLLASDSFALPRPTAAGISQTKSGILIVVDTTGKNA